MPRLVSFLFLTLATLLPAQQPAQPAGAPAPSANSAPVRTVLRALPLGGDDDINSQPHPAEQPTPPPTAPTAPPVTQPVRPAVAVTPPTAPELVRPTPAAAIPLPASPQLASPLNLKPTGDDALRLQIFLDQSNFGPGVIDGKPGRFTELAVQSWNEVHGHPADNWSAVNTAARKAIPHPLATAVVPESVSDWVDSSLPYKYSLQAKRKRMSYRSVGEYMSERYHCSLDYLVELNGSSKINNLKPRDTITVPNVAPFPIENVTGAEFKTDDAMSMRHAVVDTKINQVRIFEAAPPAVVIAEPGAEPTTPVRRPNRGLIASFPITPGQPKFIKFGTWVVRNSVELPYWRYDQKLLESGKRSADSESLNIPPGPNSPVGIFWCGLSKPGIGLHGTSTPETIGRARSAGCIRLANWDAIRLPTLIRPGTTVEIR
jgi:lipoprotein-anchoring transpeptidase ErfK/SrfK